MPCDGVVLVLPLADEGDVLVDPDCELLGEVEGVVVELPDVLRSVVEVDGVLEDPAVAVLPDCDLLDVLELVCACRVSAAANKATALQLISLAGDCMF